MSIAIQDFRVFDRFVEVPLSDGQIKTIRIEDLKTIIDSLVVEEGTGDVEPMMLPTGCYAFAQSSGVMKISCYYPGILREISLMKRNIPTAQKFTIPFPNIIITHSLQKEGEDWRISDTRYLATHKGIGELPLDRFLERSDTSDGIWVLPLPNIYSEGRACFGENTMLYRFSKNFRGLDWYFKFLFSTPFNEDLQIRSLKTQHTVSEWIQYLSTQTEFPYDKLVDYKEDSQ